MPATIKIKNSSTTGAVPTASDLVQGELAVNVTDLGLYTENASGTVVKLNAPSIDDKGTGATKRLTIDTSGNLGLGVTPSAWQAAWGKIIQAGAGASFNGTTSNSQVFMTANGYYDGSNWRYIGTDYASSYYQTNSQHIWRIAASGTAGNVISWTQAMTLDASGNLGVGTTSPSNRLSVVSASGSDGFISISSPTSETAGVSVNGGTDSNKGAIVRFQKGASTKWTMGTDSAIIGGTSDNFHLYGGGANAILFSTNATERARIDSSGNLLVGTTSASNKLYVKSTATAVTNYLENSSASPYGLQIQYTGAAPNNTSNEFIYCADTGNNRFIVYASGNVANRNNSYGGISDVKLKENIVDATPKLEGLMQVKVRNYNLIGDTQKQIGVVAQELEEVFPGMIDESPDFEEVTTTNEDGTETTERVATGTTTKQVKYSVFVPMLIKAIQEQQAIITQLQADVAALKG